MEIILGEEEAGGAHELSYSLSRRDNGELVSEARHCACQRRGCGWSERARRLSRGAAEDAPVVPACVSIRTEIARRTGDYRLD